MASARWWVCAGRATAAAALWASVLPAFAGGDPTAGTWTTTLQARDLDDDGGIDAYYDTDLDITWLADASAARTNGVDPDGNLNWHQSRSWADAFALGAYDDWRLPQVTQLSPAEGCSGRPVGDLLCGYAPSTDRSELAHMFFVTLGNKALLDENGSPQPDWGLLNTADFENLEPVSYWSGFDYLGNRANAWYFSANQGFQSFDDKFASLGYSAWLVHEGDIGVAVVPEPGAASMMLLGLFAMARRMRRRQPNR